MLPAQTIFTLTTRQTYLTIVKVLDSKAINNKAWFKIKKTKQQQAHLNHEVILFFHLTDASHYLLVTGV